MREEYVPKLKYRDLKVISKLLLVDLLFSILKVKNDRYSIFRGYNVVGRKSVYIQCLKNIIIDYSFLSPLCLDTFSKYLAIVEGIISSNTDLLEDILIEGDYKEVTNFIKIENFLK